VSKLIKHTGVVSQIVGNDIIVDMERSSACATCESKSMCSTHDSKTQQIKISNDSYNVKAGDTVNIVSERSLSMYSVLLAFAVPLFLLLATIIILTEMFDVSEGISAFAAIVVIAVYYVIVHFFDYKIKTKIKFRIEKQFN
jgi:positive regulator of sigma E activity